jgi:RNA polymerase sigma-70 factor (ECF subfamily)
VKNGELMNDSDLVSEFRRGNREAFSELVRRHSKPLTMMILRMIRDPEEARDISQMVFLKAFEGLPRFMMASSFKTWLYRIAINAVKDHLRRRRAGADNGIVEHLPDPAPSQSQRLEDVRYVQHLRQAIDQLPEKQRLTLQLRIYEEMDYKEIAAIMGGTPGRARANFFQASRKLRDLLGQYHE